MCSFDVYNYITRVALQYFSFNHKQSIKESIFHQNIFNTNKFWQNNTKYISLYLTSENTCSKPNSISSQEMEKQKLDIINSIQKVRFW